MERKIADHRSQLFEDACGLTVFNCDPRSAI